MRRPSATRVARSALLAALVLVVAAVTLRATAQGSAPKAPPDPAALTTASGVYTTGQASRGETTFGNICQGCHTTSAYMTEKFKDAWTGQPLSELFVLISQTMPDDAPGSLAAPEYAQVIAYILKLNGMPAGKDELPPDPTALKKIRIEFKQRGQTPWPEAKR